MLKLQPEQTLEVSFVNIFFNALTDYIVVFFEHRNIFLAHVGRHFISHVNELAEVGVVFGIGGNMTQGIDEFFAAPAIDFFHRGQFRAVDVADIEVRRAKLVFFTK